MALALTSSTACCTDAPREMAFHQQVAGCSWQLPVLASTLLVSSESSDSILLDQLGFQGCLACNKLCLGCAFHFSGSSCLVVSSLGLMSGEHRKHFLCPCIASDLVRLQDSWHNLIGHVDDWCTEAGPSSASIVAKKELQEPAKSTLH